MRLETRRQQPLVAPFLPSPVTRRRCVLRTGAKINITLSLMHTATDEMEVPSR